MTNKHLYTAFLVILAASALMGCGSRNIQNSTDSASTASTDTPTGSKPVASCNKVVQDDFDIRLMAVKDANGAVNNSLVRLKFVKVPDSFMSDGYNIEIRKWTASSTGVITPADTASPEFANVRFDARSSSGIYNSASTWNFNLMCSTCLNIDWYNLKLLVNKDYTSANAFFDKYHLLIDLQDSTGDWKALQIVLTLNNAPVKWVDILIPTFDANPADYKLTHPAVLNNKHPFISMLDQGFSSSQFQTQSNSFCF
jgi:hypothetical protein